MSFFYHFLESIQNLLSLGGNVLYLIFLIVFLFWAGILERFWYLKFHFKTDVKKVLAKWPKLLPSPSDYSILHLRVKSADISYLHALLTKNLSSIKTLVSICPLVGLLGTVTGMVSVFEIMSAVGTGNARLMASGISMATIPTMAGMVAALSGIYIHRVLENRITKEKQKLNDYFTKYF